MSLLSVTAHDIDAAGLTLDAELPAAWLDAELADASVTVQQPGQVHVRLSRTGDDVIVRGRVRAAFTVPCARCTQPAAVAVDTELTLLLQPAPKAALRTPANPAKGKSKTNGKADEEYEFTAAEADSDTYDGETVELDPFVREAILLEVPNFPLCSEGCPGIRPAAAPAPEESEPRIDPRLAPLADVKRALSAKLEDATKRSADRVSKPPEDSPTPKPARPTKKNKE
jgi:uncharacterized protein